jgi:hypothetical protein
VPASKKNRADETRTASTSAVVNRALRTAVSPLLRQLGFDKVDARNGWRWLDKSIWVFNIRAVGNYFAETTGWPPGSVGVWLGVYYTFMPADAPTKPDADGRLHPAEHACHMRTHLEAALDQGKWTTRLRNAAERRRADIWWVEPDGSNAAPVAMDIARAIERVGVGWFERQSDLATALREVEGERDCLSKFDRAAFLAREIGDQARWQKYAALAMTQAAGAWRKIYDNARYGM